MVKNIFILLLICQLSLIVYLGFYIKKKLGLGKTISIAPINKNDVDVKGTKTLKYFYEPKANTIEPALSWNPYKATYTINSDTLNERFDYTVEKPKKTYRIITLGDSFTYGLFVDTKDNWTEKLEGILNEKLKCPNINNFQVINLGVYGYDLQYSVKRFRVRAIKYKPDLVLWLIIASKRINEKLFPLLEKEKEKLIESDKFNNLNIFDQHYIPWDMALDDIVKEIGKEGIYNYQKQSLTDMRNIYTGKLALLMEPWLNQEQEKAFIEFSNKHEFVYFYDKIVDSRIKELHFENDNHPNQTGHKRIAEDVFDYLMKNKIIPCD